MNKSEKSAFSQIVDTAHTIHGAMRTGKAVAGATAGLALGAGKGPIVAAIIFTVLPILFVLLLPSVIFGGLNSGGAAAILNDNTAIMANINDLTSAIQRVLEEGIQDARKRIDRDFAATGGDRYEVVNPYEENLTANTSMLLAQYCAARSADADWKAISRDDLTEFLRQGLSSLYSFTRTSEMREAEDSDSGETQREKWYIYTLVYNGEGCFADEIFHLSDRQKNLAGSYAENLSMFLRDGLLQHTEYTGTTTAPLGDVRFTDGATEVVYFNQLDARYANQPYGTDNIGGYGCGPTAMSIVVSSLTGNIVDPIEMARWSYENGGWCSKSGSYHSLIPNAAKAWGLPVSGCTASEPQRIVDALSSGKLVVAIMTKGHFTKGGHFIVLRGEQDGKILVADPASYNRSQKLWNLSIILDEASDHAGAGGPFWIIGL